MDSVPFQRRYQVSIRLSVFTALLTLLLVVPSHLGGLATPPSALAAGVSASGSPAVSPLAYVHFVPCITVDIEIVPSTPVNPTFESLSAGITDKCRDSNGNPSSITDVYVAITDLLSCPDGAAPVVNYQKTFGPLVASFYRTVTFLYRDGEIVCEINGIFPTLGQTLKGNAVGTIVATGQLASGNGQATYNFLSSGT
jgi:hypothetical protein